MPSLCGSTEDEILMGLSDHSGDSDSDFGDHQRLENEKREQTYTAYGLNLEASVRLLNCSRNLTLVEKKQDPKAR
jgi:hypothetical protein